MSLATYFGELPSIQTKMIDSAAAITEQRYARSIRDKESATENQEEEMIAMKILSLKNCPTGRCNAKTTGVLPRNPTLQAAVMEHIISPSPAHARSLSAASYLRNTKSSATTKAKTPSVISPTTPKKRTLDLVDQVSHDSGSQRTRYSIGFNVADQVYTRETARPRHGGRWAASDFESGHGLPRHEVRAQQDLIREYEETVVQRVLLEKQLQHSMEAHNKSLYELQKLRGDSRHAARRVSLTCTAPHEMTTRIAGKLLQEQGLHLSNEQHCLARPNRKAPTKIRHCSEERLQKLSASSNTKGQFAIDLAQRFAVSLSLTGHRDLQASFCLIETHVLQVLCYFGLPLDNTPGLCEKVEFYWSDFGALLEEMARIWMYQKTREELSETEVTYSGNVSLFEARAALEMAECMATNSRHLVAMVNIVIRKIRTNISAMALDDEGSHSLIQWLDSQVARMTGKLYGQETSVVESIQPLIDSVVDYYPSYGRSLSRPPTAVFDKHGSNVIIRQIASITRLRSFFLRRLDDTCVRTNIYHVLRPLCLPRRRGESPLLSQFKESGLKRDMFCKRESSILQTLLENGYGGLTDQWKRDDGIHRHRDHETIIEIQERLEKLAVLLNKIECTGRRAF